MSKEQAMTTSSNNSDDYLRPVSPAPSVGSMKSDRSKDDPLNFSKNGLSPLEKERPVSPAPSEGSLKSSRSKDDPPNFSQGALIPLEKERSVSPAPSDGSLKSSRSKDDPPNFSKGALSSPQSQKPVHSSVSVNSDPSKDDPRNFTESSHIQEKDPKHKLLSNLKERIISQYKNELSQHKHETELYEIVKGKGDKPKKLDHGDLFKKNEVQIVLTKGSHGVGKTFQTRKFMVDWAKGKFNKDIDLILALHFSELNSRQDEDQSMEDFLNHHLNNQKQAGVSISEECKVLFVLDGLEECQLPLNFENNKNLTDLKEAASMDVLLTNLIKGDLLPSAKIWIISQPSHVDKIPADYIHKVTECREKDLKKKLTAILKEKMQKEYEKERREDRIEAKIYEIKTSKNKTEVKTSECSYNNLFSPKEVRVVLTEGVADIGKTFQTRKFMIDWAKGKSNKDIDLILALHFSELNSRQDEDQSMEDFLNHHLNNQKQAGVSISDECKVLFLLDGLEKCKPSLDFKNNKNLTDLKEAASMDVLLTNLIKGDLLPSAKIWIISQPSHVDKIPADYIHKVTECRETPERRQTLVKNLKKRFLTEYSQDEDLTHPNQTNTEHIMREDSTEVNGAEKSGQTVIKSIKQMNSISDIFNDGNGKQIRTVLTIGEADIGKSFHMKKFIKDWAKNEKSMFTWFTDKVTELLWSKPKVEEVIFPLNFSKLNLTKDTKVSLVDLINNLFEETKKSVISDFTQLKVLFALDGLDRYQTPLDFDNNETLTDVRKPALVDVLLTNLIKGNLLPRAQVWITSRPSHAKQLPVDRMTEIREKPDVASHRKLKSQLKEQFTQVAEGIDRQKTSALLNEIFTDLYIIEGERGEVNAQSESRHVQDANCKPVGQETPIKYHDIFRTAPGDNKPIRTVLTIGIAGIGKTFASMKYMLDWAEGKAVENRYYTFPLPFRELNLRKDSEHSFEQLLHQFFPAMETSEINDYDKYNILLVLDGFDEYRLNLDFSKSPVWRDMKAPTSVNVLLTNLIQGNLLPNAQIWITSRPAASNNIPSDKVDRVTEVRGFNDDQKEEYFRKRFSDKDLAEKILSHVKKSRSLYIMCHIPVFCWITSEVLEDFVKRNQEEGMPKTLTDMYIHLLLLQCRQANVKYGEDETGESSETDSCWNTRNKETILSLAKLAFEGLEKRNFLFCEENLTEYGVDITRAAVFSGLFTQIKREGRGLYQQKLFFFAHLSIQEFLAAFYAFHTFNNKGENVLTTPASIVADLNASDFYKKAVDKALDSEHGDWDMFLRFLLGLSLETNMTLLQELLKKTENKNTNKETIKYIKEKIREENSDADKNLNLFYCLNELNDHSLVKEVKKYMSETQTFGHFSAAEWSALTFVLLTSDEKLDVFDLKKYLKSEKVLLGMLPVVKVSKTTLLSWCELSEESCKGLTSSVLTSPSSNLTELDLSHNDLLDSGVELLARGLENLHCKLEILKLLGCQVTEKGCSFLALALKSNRSSTIKELDLSYNHPGDNGAKMLSVLVEDPDKKLKTLSLEHGGEHRLKPGLKKYYVDLKFDESTVSKRLVLSEGNRKVRIVKRSVERVSRPENKDRFKRTQVFCEEGLKGICYWEVEWWDKVGIAVAYNDVGRKWDRTGGLGCNEVSWSLICSKDGYIAIHGNVSENIQKPLSHKIAVLLDWESGNLSYHSVSSGELSLIHTFKAKFTEPLFPGFWLRNGSVALCNID
ncbi:NLR family CARD domain-containing protein 3 CARD15-like protein Caterpiller protein 16.2 [Channa argus]|uniref:NLR family CARD domain-containing protein 3 CARD15-like protein Caterpiller protein 16.2 n=1 Tax=Channa argus TaxID=215402 RepID=A0A6G1Q2P7_CHAAH|nr:NLR family CARD domain-containing protein 3 CARD15-like protein Caterpiller protein 16.2 [Channa argus]